MHSTLYPRFGGCTYFIIVETAKFKTAPNMAS
jgi:predicted Fe-Mo cluster-binding NifX family protein